MKSLFQQVSGKPGELEPHSPGSQVRRRQGTDPEGLLCALHKGKFPPSVAPFTGSTCPSDSLKGRRNQGKEDP